MAIYYANNGDGTYGFYITAEIPLANIPSPKTLITEAEWKAALALGVDLEPDGVTGKPVAKAVPATGVAFVARLYFHDACRATSYGGGTVWSALQARLPALSATDQARYADIAKFRRTAAEIVTYFQDAGGVNLTGGQLDTLFAAAAALEAAA